MDSAIEYPTWTDVGVPDYLLRSVESLNAGEVMDYLVHNRVFRVQVRPAYEYTCGSCSHRKKIYRTWEDYSVCEKCNCEYIYCKFFLRTGKDEIPPYSTDDSLTSSIIHRLADNYTTYFREFTPDDFFDSHWNFDKSTVRPPKSDDIGYGSMAAKHVVPARPSNAPQFYVKFCCGDQVSHTSQALAICRASLLCPFLWDDRFDWKYEVFKDRQNEASIIPLLYVWSRLVRSSPRKISASKSDNSRGYAPPQWNPPDDFVSDDEQIFTAIIGRGSSNG